MESSYTDAQKSLRRAQLAELGIDDDIYEVELHVSRQLSDYYPGWHLDAACLGQDVNDWFGYDESRPMTPRQIREVGKVCDSCPVFAQCLRNALEMGEQYGVWAGTSGRVRRRIQAMISLDVVTIDEVIEDYCDGQRSKYEDQDSKRRIDAELRGRKEGIRAQAAG